MSSCSKESKKGFLAFEEKSKKGKFLFLHNEHLLCAFVCLAICTALTHLKHVIWVHSYVETISRKWGHDLLIGLILLKNMANAKFHGLTYQSDIKIASSLK